MGMMEAMLEQTEMENVYNYQVVSPVEHVEDKENGGEKIHGDPIHSLIRHLYLLPHTPTVSLVVCPLPVDIGMFQVHTIVFVERGGLKHFLHRA